jgi:hypothetical protein
MRFNGPCVNYSPYLSSPITLAPQNILNRRKVECQQVIQSGAEQLAALERDGRKKSLVNLKFDGWGADSIERDEPFFKREAVAEGRP